MMARVKHWLYFETEIDYDQSVGTKDFYKGGRIKKPKNFPAYLVYYDGWAGNFCGEWAEPDCEKNEAREAFLKVIIEEIKRHEEEINSLKNLLKKA